MRLSFALDRHDRDDWPASPAAVSRGSAWGTPGLPVGGPLETLVPGGSLRRGSSVGIQGAGASALALALLAGPLAGGSWGAVLGWPELGLEAAAELGVPLTRLALVPDPGTAWWEAAAALVDAVDVVVLRPPARPAAGLARRLVARVRERRTVLVVVQRPGPSSAEPARWPEPLDVVLSAERSTWYGLHAGYGVLAGRELEVRSSGRRVPGGGTCARLALPGAGGPLATASTPTAPAAAIAPAVPTVPAQPAASTEAAPSTEDPDTEDGQAAGAVAQTG